MIETPRLLKKPGGLYKRVENQSELDAALADGWFVRLPVVDIAPVTAREPLVKSPEDVPAPIEEGDKGPTEEQAPKKRGPGRPKKSE